MDLTRRKLVLIASTVLSGVIGFTAYRYITRKDIVIRNESPTEVRNVNLAIISGNSTVFRRRLVLYPGEQNRYEDLAFSDENYSVRLDTMEGPESDVVANRAEYEWRTPDSTLYITMNGTVTFEEPPPA